MRTLYLRNVPEETARALEEIAERESMSVSALAVRELQRAVAFRANADALRRAPVVRVSYADIVDSVREAREARDR